MDRLKIVSTTGTIMRWGWPDDLPLGVGSVVDGRPHDKADAYVVREDIAPRLIAAEDVEVLSSHTRPQG